MAIILNLGCGNKIIPGAIHHDRTKHRPEIEVVHDLNILPWPWEDKSADGIVALAVFEHLDIDLLASLNECHRILRTGGRLTIKLPLANVIESYDDPTHRWFYSMRSLDQFCPETDRGRRYSFYTPLKWRYAKKPWGNRKKGLGTSSSLWAVMETI